ncbi:EGF domain-specific O-linked N-acetylglucosamine transferase [Ditylenchus destructor]|nr:EGF domain-specific O-linked N-acetylglucosamine transferase [Ditylenchus destructor]
MLPLFSLFLPTALIHALYQSASFGLADSLNDDEHSPVLNAWIELVGRESRPQTNRCWGFESDCDFSRSYSAEHVKCTRNSKRPGLDTPGLTDLFWKQGDFGSLRERQSTIATICDSDSETGSFLECSDHLRFCRGRNIFFDLKNLNAKTSSRYRSDVIRPGEVGGKCNSFFDLSLLKQRGDEPGYLQSWAGELRHFSPFENFDINDPTACDVVFDRPTVVIKLDAAVNMYHHFCDFVNLFASQFLNNTYFGKDVDILWWDTYSGGFHDSWFGATWKVFSIHKPHELVHFDGKKVCFRNVMLPLLARQLRGLYYNMPLVDGCHRSGLFHAFSHHVLHRLGINQEMAPKVQETNESTKSIIETPAIRVTLLDRKTPHRKIANVDELVNALRGLPGVIANVVNYDPRAGLTFLDQLKITHNSDIFIGMHGSGLTHLLFLPDWAAIFEIYNCDDEHCYRDLARLRGVKYWTWKKGDKVFPVAEGRHPTLNTPHKKFTDYRFDVGEFLRIVKQMIEYVRIHPEYVKYRRQWRQNDSDSRNSSQQQNEQLPKRTEL